MIGINNLSFAHLTEDQRKALIEKRQANCGDNIAKMLLATSLAKQPDLRPYLKTALIRSRISVASEIINSNKWR